MSKKQQFEWELEGKRYGGLIEGWVRNPILNNEKVMGILTKDPQGRFDENNIITTSKVVKIHNTDDGKILETQHSYYRLGRQGTKEDLYEYYKRYYGGAE